MRESEPGSTFIDPFQQTCNSARLSLRFVSRTDERGILCVYDELHPVMNPGKLPKSPEVLWVDLERHRARLPQLLEFGQILGDACVYGEIHQALAFQELDSLRDHLCGVDPRVGIRHLGHGGHTAPKRGLRAGRYCLL